MHLQCSFVLTSHTHKHTASPKKHSKWHRSQQASRVSMTRCMELASVVPMAVWKQKDTGQNVSFHHKTKNPHIYQNTLNKYFKQTIFQICSICVYKQTRWEKELTMPNVDTAQCNAKHCKTASIQCLHLTGDQSAQQWTNTSLFLSLSLLVFALHNAPNATGKSWPTLTVYVEEDKN